MPQFQIQVMLAKVNIQMKALKKSNREALEALSPNLTQPQQV